MRVCVVYDCLYPYTVGGAERWYRNLAERLAADGHDVTFLTLRQWDAGVEPDVAGVRVIAVGPRMALYSGPGQRRILPPLVFGLGVLWHLLWHGRRYQVVHTASFPYFSVLAAAVLAPLHRYRILVDWHELWTLEYWRSYLGSVGGTVGWIVQRLCVAVPQRAFCFSRLYAERLRAGGLRGEVTVLSGEYEGPLETALVRDVAPVIAFAGRHIPEKQAPAVVDAIAAARAELPELTGVVLGDGPERPQVLERIAALGLSGVVTAPGFVATEEVQETLGHALALLLPSRREGYGMVVIEAASQGTPSILVRGEDNAATELVVEGENGYVVDSADPDVLAAAIRRVAADGPALRERTVAWFAANAERLSLSGSLSRVSAAYAAASGSRRASSPR